MRVYRMSEEGGVQESDYETYPLLMNSEIVGIIDVYRDSDGSIAQISLGTDYAYELQDFIDSCGGTAFSILHTDSGVYTKLASEDFACCLKSYVGNEYNIDVSDSVTMEYTPLSYASGADVEFTQSGLEIQSSNDILFNTLNVTNVSNTSTTCCPDGICWAASIAIMANYHIGTSYTALQVHNLCGCLTDNYHSEEKSYIRQLGMNAGGPYYSSGSYPFCFSTLYDCIEADMLLLLDFQDYDEDIAHNVVAYGYYASTSSTTTYFYYMDPNTGGKISSFPSSSSDPVCVSLSGYNYELHCYITAY